MPTLLTSRPPLARDSEQRKGRRSAPTALELPGDEWDASPLDFQIKNTFIEGAARRSPSFDRFYRERALQTCPSKQTGQLASLLHDFASGATQASAAWPMTPPPPGLPTPCNIQTPMGDGFWRPPQPCWAAGLPIVDLSSLTNTEGFLGNGFVGAAAPAVPSGCAGWGRPPQEAPQPRLRSVLSLAEALRPEAAGEPQPSHYDDFLNAPLTPAACLLNLGPRQQPPPPPSAAPRGLSPAAAVPPPPAPPASPTGLAVALEAAAVAGLALPSMGSAAHGLGACKPCAFLYSKGCQNGPACTFCHVCGPEELKRRRKDKVHRMRASKKDRPQVADCAE